MHHPNSVDMQGPLPPEGVAEDGSLRAENDIVMLDKHRENLERKLERWRYTLETRGLRINRKMTEYMKTKLNGNLQTTIKLGGGNISRAHEFKYIGSAMGKKASTIQGFLKRALSHCSYWRATQEELDHITQVPVKYGYPNRQSYREINKALDTWYGEEQYDMTSSPKETSTAKA
ncbi:uncharacterized protein [Palaemon carinicauda]|uniref:uncharacterized protein n=1 Tax=Palaemon carinicauda TaxID=392227 RepID=UPI0035B5D29F